MLSFYTAWKQQKGFLFSSIFRGYKTLTRNGLSYSIDLRIFRLSLAKLNSTEFPEFIIKAVWIETFFKILERIKKKWFHGLYGLP